MLHVLSMKTKSFKIAKRILEKKNWGRGHLAILILSLNSQVLMMKSRFYY